MSKTNCKGITNNGRVIKELILTEEEIENNYP